MAMVKKLDQHDYSYDHEEFEKNIKGYAEPVGNFMIHFSGLEHTLELCIAELITERSDDLGLIGLSPSLKLWTLVQKL